MDSPCLVDSIGASQDFLPLLAMQKNPHPEEGRHTSEDIILIFTVVAAPTPPQKNLTNKKQKKKHKLLIVFK
jgi:hypothetical protein